MNLKILLLILPLISSFSCEKESVKSDTFQNLQLIWKKYRGDDRITGCTTPVLSEQGVLYSQDFYLSEDQSRFFLFDKKTGNSKWEWADYLNVNEAPSYILDYHLFDEKFTFSTSKNSYCININTGTTQWKGNNGGASAGQMTGIDGKIFGIFGGANDSEVLKAGHINTGYSKEIYANDTISGETKHIIREPAINVDNLGDTILYFTSNIYPKGPVDPGYPKTFVKFNISKNRIEYEKPMKTGYDVRAGLIHNDRIYFNEYQSVTCYSLDNFELIWEKNINSIASISDFLIENGNLYINSEEPNLYCLDPETGNELWKTKSSGTSSHIGYYKGKLYIVGGGTGKLHCYDADTGEELYTMESPDYQSNNNASFNTVLALDKEEGRLYLASFQSAICYQILD